MAALTLRFGLIVTAMACALTAPLRTQDRMPPIAGQPYLKFLLPGLVMMDVLTVSFSQASGSSSSCAGAHPGACSRALRRRRRSQRVRPRTRHRPNRRCPATACLFRFLPSEPIADIDACRTRLAHRYAVVSW